MPLTSKKLLIASFILVSSTMAFSQDDLLDMVTPEKSDLPVIATFKGTRIINAHTVETVKKRNLDFRVAHRFGNLAGKNSRHSLYGFDSSDDINIAFEYGVTNNLTVGISRSKRQEAIQGSIKYRVLHQTESNSTPISLTFLSSNVLFAEASSLEGNYNYDKYAHRLSYVNQFILGKKFSDNLSLQLIPTLIHRNWVFNSQDENTNFAIGFGGRVKLTKRSAIVGDVFYTFSNFRKNNPGMYLMPPLSLGYEIETGGHVFTLMFSNAKGLLENDYLVNTTESWGKGAFKFSFLISRNFKI